MLRDTSSGRAASNRAVRIAGFRRSRLSEARCGLGLALRIRFSSDPIDDGRVINDIIVMFSRDRHVSQAPQRTRPLTILRSNERGRVEDDATGLASVGWPRSIPRSRGGRGETVVVHRLRRERSWPP
jgi:hypothetical protein